MRPGMVKEGASQMIASEENPKRFALATGRPGGKTPTMDARVTRLETHMEYVRTDLSEIKATQKETEKAIAGLTTLVNNIPLQIETSQIKISNEIKELPTKSELKNYNLQMIGIGVAILILVVGGIVGGLDGIEVN